MYNYIESFLVMIEINTKECKMKYNKLTRGLEISCNIYWRPAMIRVMICEDDDNFMPVLCNCIEKALKRNQVEYRVFSYSHIQDISTPVLEHCDIAFLDIDFSGEQANGIDIARRIRLSNSNAVVIFVTNYIEYAPEGYEVQALRYVLKKDAEKKLPECVEIAINNLTAINDSLHIQINGEAINLKLTEIMFIESDLRMVKIHVASKKDKRIYKCYASISDLENQLKEKGFTRSHKSFLVNMNYINVFQCHEMKLIDGTILPVSAHKYAEQKKKYLIWKGFQ